MAEKVSNAKTTKVNKDMVTVKLFKSRDKRYSQPVRVYINGVGYTVPRGIDVEVPRAVAEVLANKERQENETAELISSLESRN